MPKLCNSEISSLLFADDLAILALSKPGHQDKIDLLEKNCEDWGLKLNLKKTKILIFNKQGAVVKSHKFYFQAKEIEIVNQYTFRSSHRRCSVRKRVLRNFAKFTGKHLFYRTPKGYCFCTFLGSTFYTFRKETCGC